ncbi:hypothetical protein D0N36_00330 [Hymenobacter lapidiphilus]|uniref:hypothetical protein n=1 Tax=Hymenobacter sp. CCM 8763 TaxID=2303334 RepID=UPI000E34A172|nr:hypothetical protein [Hymenobacter sp. CCM 8763]RFP66971.1 hypothetical protein D0N36_00330 [Hymenobacter sp. CCM 8763]
MVKTTLLALGLLLAVPGVALAQQRLSQVQVARRFWMAAVGQEWKQAYRWLAPATQATMSQKQFRQMLQPLRKPVCRFGSVIDLYKLGFRLRDAAAPEPFVAYSFRADTLAARPHFQLDVSFQDSTARRVKVFRLIEVK